MSQDAFQKAAKEVVILNKRPDNGELSALYGLYKQATVGDVIEDRPRFYNIAGCAKWDAWIIQKGLSKDEAMTSYIKLVEELKVKYGISSSS